MHGTRTRADAQQTALAYWTAAVDLLVRSGYTISIRYDLREWASYVRSKPDCPIVNPTLDPDCSDLDASNSLWVDIHDRSGRRAAVSANRVMHCSDFAEAFASGHAHYAHPSSEHRMQVRPEVPRGLMTGRIGHAGGLYVEPHAKKEGFPWLASPLMRALSIISFGVDRQCGAIFGHLKDAGFIERAYRFPDWWLAVDGYFPPIGKEAKVYIMHIGLDAMVEQLRADAARIMANRDQKLGDLAAIIGKRKEKPWIPGGVAEVASRNVG
jgi:hypothetical protein